jgi:hypothetical protein
MQVIPALLRIGVRQPDDLDARLLQRRGNKAKADDVVRVDDKIVQMADLQVSDAAVIPPQIAQQRRDRCACLATGQ